MWHRVWVKAAEQVFYSLGIGWGSLITFGSFNPHNHDFLTDSYLVPLINAGTSLFAGFAVTRPPPTHTMCQQCNNVRMLRCLARLGISLTSPG